LKIAVTKRQAKWADEAAQRGNVLKINLKTMRIEEVPKEKK